MDDAEPFGHYAHSDFRLLQLLQIRGASLSCLYFERFTGLEFFSQATNAAISGLVWGGSLLKRIYIPSTFLAFLPLGQRWSAWSFRSCRLLSLCLWMERLLWSMLFLPVSILILTAFTLGFGL